MKIIKVCIKCNKEKDIELFGKNSKTKDNKDSTCRECRRAYDNEYYKKRYSDDNTRSRRNDLKKNIRERNSKFIYNYLKNNPCVNCGENDPIVLEFDHIDESEKDFNISDSGAYSLDKISKEIDKCQVLCANCHRRKTAIQFNWYSW